ncbi:MAG: hypothetical protein KGI94_07185 [Paracoccaceae bacterium]|nr:hypothetical protein [Paracoccaceae bacterium]
MQAAVLIAVLTAALALAGVARAAPVTMTPAELRALGFREMAAHRPAAAHDIALALLHRDPKDFLALILQARSARAMGLNPEARQAAREAWAQAQGREQEYLAAEVRAQVLASSDMRPFAQFWLRRAADLAPDPAVRQRAIRDLNYVRSRSHWVLRFSASVQPSSNVNNGSANSTISILGLPFLLSGDARALSGVVASGDAEAIYRFTPTERALSRLHFHLGGTHNWLSAAAQRQAPLARGSNYDYLVAEAGFAQRLRASRRSLAIYDWDVTAGHNWYGGHDLSDYLRGSLSVERPVSAWLTAFGGVSLERQVRRDSFTRSAVVATGYTGMNRRLGNGDELGLTLGLRDTNSAAIDINHHGAFAQLRWQQATPVLGIRLDASAYMETGVYGASIFAPNGRHDVTRQAQISALFTRVNRLGFAPELTLQWRQVQSNVSLYAARGLSVGLAVKSVF